MKFIIKNEMFDTIIDSDHFDAPSVQAIAERLDGQGSKGWIVVPGMHPGYDRIISIGNPGNFPYMVRTMVGTRILSEYEAISELHAALTVERVLRYTKGAQVMVVPLEAE